MLDLEPARSDGHDLSDWAAGAVTDEDRVEAKRVIVAAAESVEPITRSEFVATTEPAIATPQTTVRFLTPAELHAQTPPEPDWLLDGYLARGVLTIGPAGKPKVGKSTLSLAIVRAIRADAGRFLNRPVRSTAVVYLAEESASTLLHKLPADDPGLHILTRDNAYPRPPWAELVAVAVEHALQVDAGLLVVDTFPYWAALPAEREKDAGAIQEAVEPLLSATRQGLAVMVPAHTRKGGGEDGDALRGSSALAGAGDIILELERPTGQNPAPRQRILAALSRYPQTPGVLVLEHDAGTDAWSVVGEGEDRRDTRAVADRAALLSALPTSEPGMTRNELEDEIGSPHQQFAPTLARLIDEGQATRDGAGKKGDPYRYRILRNTPAQHPRTNAELSGAHPFRDAPERTSIPFCAETQVNGHAADGWTVDDIDRLVAEHGGAA